MSNKKSVPVRGAYFALVVATLALIINFWAWSLLSPLGSLYARELSLTPTMLALLLALPVLVGSLGRIVLGVLTDSFGGKTMFTAVCFITALPVLGLAFAQSYQQLVIVAFLLGLGGAVFAIGVPFISAWFPPERRGLVLGIYSMGNVGTAVSAFMTPRLTSAVGRTQTFVIVAGLLIAMGLLFAVRAHNSPIWRAAKGSPLGRIKGAFGQSITWDLSAVYAVTFGAFVAFGVYLPVLLKIAYDLSLTDAASRAAGFVLLATIARPLGGWLSDKVGGQRVIQVGLFFVIVLAGIVAAQSALTPHATMAYLSLAVVLGCCNGAVFALVGKLTKPEFMGSVTGVVGAIGGLGGFFPPLVLGLTYQYTNSYSLALIGLALAALAVLVHVSQRFRNTKTYKPVL